MDTVEQNGTMRLGDMPLCEDALACPAFPSEHRTGIRTDNVREGVNREIRHRTSVVRILPSPGSLVGLVGAVLADMNDRWSGGRLMHARGMADIGRDAVPETPPTDGVLEMAELIVMEAMRAAGSRWQSTPVPWVDCAGDAESLAFGPRIAGKPAD